jgi:hypothetical protein
MLSHAIKVQFFNLNFQFYNVENLTLLVGMIRDILEVEKPNSYIKQPAKPMVTIKMSDITHFLGSIQMSSFDIKDPIDTTYYQQIIYLGLLDQCQKCRRFTHFANACQI